MTLEVEDRPKFRYKIWVELDDYTLLLCMFGGCRPLSRPIHFRIPLSFIVLKFLRKALRWTVVYSTRLDGILPFERYGCYSSNNEVSNNPCFNFHSNEA